MIIDLLAGFISGILGAMGFGGGGILILYLTLYKDIPQLTAQGINLLFFIPSAIVALIIHTKNKLINWKTAFKYTALGLIGVGIGYYVVTMLNDNALRKIFAIILLLVGFKSLFTKNKN